MWCACKGLRDPHNLLITTSCTKTVISVNFSTIFLFEAAFSYVLFSGCRPFHCTVGSCDAGSYFLKEHTAEWLTWVWIYPKLKIQANLLRDWDDRGNLSCKACSEEAAPALNLQSWLVPCLATNQTVSRAPSDGEEIVHVTECVHVQIGMERTQTPRHWEGNWRSKWNNLEAQTGGRVWQGLFGTEIGQTSHTSN